ncbi:hypothetical protein [uncultured Winogradskyella sp.]|uniref:hypothetical protein n=1 Tax=uncultured Winogradskyella sp. TaxID=395353 RepID=UPI002618F4CF|nr:hypothetical protein [uncultured Winogradskyella sp.]
MKNSYFIDSENILSQCEFHIDRIFNKKSLPENIFNKDYNNLLFFVFDDIFSEEFFEYYNRYLNKNSFDEFIFYTLKPHPKNYFFKHYDFYNAIKFPCGLNYEHYNALLSNFPSENIADSLKLNSNEFIITSISDNLYFYCNRDLELGIVISNDIEKIDEISKDGIFNTYEDIKDYTEEILMLKFGERVIPAESIEFYSHLINNFLEFGDSIG